MPFSVVTEGEVDPVVSLPQRERNKAMIVANALLRRLCPQWARITIGCGTWMRHAAVARQATAGNNSEHRGRGKSSGKVGSSRKVRKEPSGAANVVVGSAAEAVEAAAPPTQQQRHKTAATHSPRSSLWSPTETEFEAFVANLMLYRRESLEPVLSALKKERALFEESVKQMETHVAELYAVRQEIRELLQEGAAVQRRALAEALRADVVSDESAKAEEEEEDVDVDEISL
ncbi:putative kinesin [Trypanosoma rangeli]|uniref:Putative kinesin n=1 Tax=Trypanosoma rangeli TaxID=5698 RepID=A0A3R7M0P0_TRYRA|nr:putative kinesin [Trypanosoma rangeli]RNF06920.1 putative kinesin [Trypanosoma rangeli]|eukprot:RNF06920.1 putative kinesin [Trypanosoma rangeli]